jgi:hypothetical protein
LANAEERRPASLRKEMSIGLECSLRNSGNRSRHKNKNQERKNHMGGCAKNGKEGSDHGSNSLLMMEGLVALGIEKRQAHALYLAPDRVYIKATLSDVQDSKIANAERSASQTYWKDLSERGICDSLFTLKDHSFAILNVHSEAEARDIIQGDPIVKAGGFKSVAYQQLHPK